MARDLGEPSEPAEPGGPAGGPRPPIMIVTRYDGSGSGSRRRNGHPEPVPYQPDDDRREQRGHETRHHHPRCIRESDRGGHDHDRVDGRRREQERQCRGRRSAAVDEAFGHRHRTAFTPRQQHAGHSRDRHRERCTPRQHPCQRATGDEGGHRPADEHAEREERGRLDRHGQEDRAPRPQPGRIGVGDRENHGGDGDQPDRRGRRAGPPDTAGPGGETGACPSYDGRGGLWRRADGPHRTPGPDSRHERTLVPGRRAPKPHRAPFTRSTACRRQRGDWRPPVRRASSAPAAGAGAGAGYDVTG